jgi:hypothetical protein
MTRPRFATLGLALAVSTLPAASRAADEPRIPAFARDVPRVRTGEPVFQFNGTDLSGFYIYLSQTQYDDPKKVFTVRDGMIHVSGDEFGGIITKQEYSDYHLIVEWKWGGPTYGQRKDRARDSGILLHCVGEDGAAGKRWMESVECQIIEGGCGDFILVAGKGRPSMTCEVRETNGGKDRYYEKGGKPVTLDRGLIKWWGRDPEWKDVPGFRGKNDVENPLGQWNRMEVICDGDSITNIVNGYVVNVGTKASVTKGKILLQTEGAEIVFRKFEVRPILKTAAPAGGG